MSFGDEIMACGHARTVHKETGKRVRIVGRDDRARWSDLWNDIPWIVKPDERGDFAKVVNGPQCRPYIKYPFSRRVGQTYSGWRARDNMGLIVFNKIEESFSYKVTQALQPFVIVEPHVPPQSNPNKQWGWQRWQALTDNLLKRQFRVAQIGLRGTKVLNGAFLIETPTFRHGAAVLRHAEGLILPEGGLHHAAGVLGLPAIVLNGGATNPKFIGYEHHLNIFKGPNCGAWSPCAHCADTWASLRPEEVVDVLVFKVIPEDIFRHEEIFEE